MAVRFAANQEGSLRVHEFGHNLGLPHRPPDAQPANPNLVMNRAVSPTARRVNAVECAAFRGPTPAITPFGASFHASDVEDASNNRMATAEAEILLAQQSGARGGSGSADADSVKDFVLRSYVRGLPFLKATRFTNEHVSTLKELLAIDETSSYHANILGLLGIIGGEESVDVIVKYITMALDKPVSPEVYRAAHSGMIALGYAVNRDGNRRALQFLSEAAARVSQSRTETINPTNDGRITVSPEGLATSAISGLSLGGRPESKIVLEALSKRFAVSSDEPTNRPITNLLSNAISTSEEVSKKGLFRYYSE